jgi:hypothetical protein
MMLEFATLQLTHAELLEIYKALSQRAEIQHLLMQEKGTEHPDHSLLHRVESLLGKSEPQLERLYEEADEEMWEYAWYAYTDEWAWWRAKQEAAKELGREPGASKEDEAKVEAIYNKKFEAFVAEVSMLDPQQGKSKKSVRSAQKRQR